MIKKTKEKKKEIKNEIKEYLDLIYESLESKTIKELDKIVEKHNLENIFYKLHVRNRLRIKW